MVISPTTMIYQEHSLILNKLEQKVVIQIMPHQDREPFQDRALENVF